MPYIIAQPIREKAAPYVVFKDLFTAEECLEITELSKVLKKEVAKVGNSEAPVLSEEKRVSDIYWVNWQPQLEPLFSRLAEKISMANKEWWGFHLAGLNEALQLTHYYTQEEKKGHYGWHEDWAESGPFSLRKISGVLLLNDGFEGGEFEFANIGAAKDLTKGTLILFPSFKTHRVMPVTKGERWSLVFWVTGPPFC